MKEIYDAGLNKLYCGMESGSLEVLKKVKKGITPESIITSAHMAKQAGMDITEFIILGLGGKELSDTHALETARVLNEINPDTIRVLTIGVKPGSGLDTQMKNGEWTRPSETDMIAEQRRMLENINNITSHYANHHSVDLLLEIRGQLPGDKEMLLGIMDRFLSLDESDRINFILGRRLGYYRSLADLTNELHYQFVGKQAEKIRQTPDHDFEQIFHDLRIQVI